MIESKCEHGNPPDCKHCEILQAADALAKAARNIVMFSTVAPLPRNHRIELSPEMMVDLRKALIAYEKLRGIK